MSILPKTLALIAFTCITTLVSPTTLANIITNYTIAPQNVLTWDNQIAGSTWGTFTADFTTNEITDINLSIHINNDITYLFNTPITFGSYTNWSLPGITYYEANLQTSTIGFWTSTFFMDFLQDNTTQLFQGNLTTVFSSFGLGKYILGNSPTAAAAIPEPAALLLIALGSFAINRTRKLKQAQQHNQIANAATLPAGSY